MTYTHRRRMARKPHRCGGCRQTIPKLDVYLVHTDFPSNPLGFAAAAGHPVRFKECARCATRHDRDHLLDPIPIDQVARLGLM